jgi:hypothetical protein
MTNLHTFIRRQKSFVEWVLARQAVIRVCGLDCDDSPGAFRKSVRDVLKFAAPIFWNVKLT